MVKEPLWRDMPNDLHKQQGLLFPNEILQQIMSQVCQEVQSGVNSYLGCACKWVSRKSIAGEYYGQACPAIVFSQILFYTCMAMSEFFQLIWLWIFYALDCSLHMEFLSTFAMYFVCTSFAFHLHVLCIPLLRLRSLRITYAFLMRLLKWSVLI